MQRIAVVLPAPFGPKEPVDFAFPDGEADRVDGAPSAEGTREPGRDERVHLFLPPPDNAGGRRQEHDRPGAEHQDEEAEGNPMSFGSRGLRPSW